MRPTAAFSTATKTATETTLYCILDAERTAADHTLNILV
jgi:hypothetical protein